jgi:fused signal recognition particle receptor
LQGSAESIVGNDALEQAKSFNWSVGIDGIILTKADVDERGGTALSVGYTTKKPILFLGTGQDYDKIQVFNKKKFVKELGL